MRLGNNTQSYISWIDLGCPLQKTKPRELFGKRVTLIYFTHVWLKSEDISELLNTTKVDFQKKNNKKCLLNTLKNDPKKACIKLNIYTNLLNLIINVSYACHSFLRMWMYKMFLTYGLFNLTHLITITIILQIPKFISENPSFLAKKTNCYYIFGVCISFKYLIKKENNSINQSSIYQRMKESVERRRKKKSKILFWWEIR